jgi:hypothetical protein
LANSMSSALSSSTSSTSSAMQQRSLSAFSSTASQNAINPLSHQRSSSTQGIPTLSSNQTTSTTLSELIAAEMARDGLVTSASKPGHKHAYSISGPSTSSDSSLPRTPSELSAVQPPSSPGYASSLLQSAIPTTYRKHKSSQSEFGFGNFSAKDSGSINSSTSTASLPRHSKTSSVPLAKLDDGKQESVFDKMRSRHRMEVQQSGLGYEPHPPVSLSPLGQAYPPVLGPQSIQGLPCPPGVDPGLYASRENRLTDCSSVTKLTIYPSPARSEARLAAQSAADDEHDANFCASGSVTYNVWDGAFTFHGLCTSYAYDVTGPACIPIDAEFPWRTSSHSSLQLYDGP